MISPSEHITRWSSFGIESRGNLALFEEFDLLMPAFVPSISLPMTHMVLLRIRIAVIYLQFMTHNDRFRDSE